MPIKMLDQIFSYAADTGFVHWKIPRRGIKIGDIAGSVCTNTGYCKITFNRKGFKAHRIAWALTYGEWPLNVVDHINGIRNDNRILNLRLATNSQNSRAMKTRKNKKCALKGVTPYKLNTGKFVAQIRVNGKQQKLGVFNNEQDAHNAYCNIALREFGAFFNPDCSCHRSGFNAVSGKS